MPQAAKRIILLTNGEDPFWDAMRSGMEKAEEDLGLKDRGLTVVMDKNDGSPDGQVNKLKQYLGQSDVAAVGISVIDPKNVAMASVMRKLREKGIAVMTIDSDVDRAQYKDTRFAYMGTENTFGGRQMGLAARALKPEGGKYAAFFGIQGVANVIERVGGFADGAGDKFTRLTEVGDGMKQEVAQDNVRNALENFPQLDTLVGIWAYNAHAIVTVVEEKKIRDKVTIVVFDAAPKAIEHLKNGKIDAMVVQDPYTMGYKGTEVMAAMYAGDDATIQKHYPDYDPSSGSFTTENGDVMNTDIRVVVPEGSRLDASVFDEGVIFFPIGEFEAWLRERNLQGS